MRAWPGVLQAAVSFAVPCMHVRHDGAVGYFSRPGADGATGPARTRCSVACCLTAACFDAASAFLLPLPVRSDLACVGRPARCGRSSPLYFAADPACACLRLLYARIAHCVLWRSIAVGRAAHRPHLGPEMGSAHAPLHVSLPLPDFDRGVVWHHKCVSTPLDYLHGLNLCSTACCVRAWPGAKQPARGGGGGHLYMAGATPAELGGPSRWHGKFFP